jgi:hypothetical protein
MLRMWPIAEGRKLRWALVAATVLVGFEPSALTQCAKGTVTIEGMVENLPPAIDADVIVILKTPKGEFSKGAKVAGGQFRVDVYFSRFKSWSALRGHNCSNLPTLVDVAVRHGNEVLNQNEFKFNDSFETHDSLTYSLKEKLTLDVSRKISDGWPGL